MDLTDLIDEANRWEYNYDLNEVRLTTSYIYDNSKKRNLQKGILN